MSEMVNHPQHYQKGGNSKEQDLAKAEWYDNKAKKLM